jgi:hypothetical protein
MWVGGSADIEVVRQLIDSRVAVDYVLSTRFDLIFRRSIDTLPIDWTKFNFCWRALSRLVGTGTRWVVCMARTSCTWRMSCLPQAPTGYYGCDAYLIAGAEDFEWNLRSRTTSDLFHAMPVRYVQQYVNALRWSGDFHGVCCLGAAHWVYRPLVEAIGEASINFIEAGSWGSTQDVANPADCPEHCNLFLSILRHCPVGCSASG